MVIWHGREGGKCSIASLHGKMTIATVMEKYTYSDLHELARAPLAPAVASRAAANDTANPLRNRLLAMLPDAERARLLPHLELIELPQLGIAATGGSMALRLAQLTAASLNREPCAARWHGNCFAQ